MTDMFTCAGCGGVFPMGDDEEARAEANQLWGERPLPTLTMTCDECHERIVARCGPKAREGKP